MDSRERVGRRHQGHRHGRTVGALDGTGRRHVGRQRRLELVRPARVLARQVVVGEAARGRHGERVQHPQPLAVRGRGSGLAPRVHDKGGPVVERPVVRRGRFIPGGAAARDKGSAQGQDQNGSPHGP